MPATGPAAAHSIQSSLELLDPQHYLATEGLLPGPTDLCAHMAPHVHTLLAITVSASQSVPATACLSPSRRRGGGILSSGKRLTKGSQARPGPARPFLPPPMAGPADTEATEAGALIWEQAEAGEGRDLTQPWAASSAWPLWPPVA